MSTKIPEILVDKGDKPSYQELEYDHAVLYARYSDLKESYEDLEARYMHSQEIIHGAKTILRDREIKD